MYKYETHLHSAPVSKCARVSVRENLEFYKSMGYDGVFLTNHFINGNINIDKELPYAEKIEFFFTDYEEALSISSEIGIKVFLGVEMSFSGNDFLIYGLDKEWYLSHPEIAELKPPAILSLCKENGALVVHAHPFREAGYIDHISLFPAQTEGVEIYNACRTDFENEMARQYAANYGKLTLAGTDNHSGSGRVTFGGVEFDTPLTSEADFIARTRAGEAKIFKDQIE